MRPGAWTTGEVDVSDSTREHVQAVLDLAQRQIDELHSLYDSSIKAATVTPALRAQIKNVLENQR